MIDTVLGVLGIALSIGLSAPVLNAISTKRVDRKRRQEWSAKIHFDEGIIAPVESCAYERWEEDISVDDDGGAAHTIGVTVVNRGDKSMDAFLFPAFCDRKHIRREELKPWARDRDGSLEVSVVEWDEELSRGLFRIKLQSALSPAARHSFQWGYFMPSTFLPGDEYFAFDITSPMFELRTQVRLSDSWKVQYARWKGTLASILEAPRTTDHAVEGIVMFPRIAERLVLEFGLVRSQTTQYLQQTAKPLTSREEADV